MSSSRPQRTWNSPDEKKAAAGADLVAYWNTDLPASGFADFVHTYFPALVAEPVGEDLRVRNGSGEEVFVRRRWVIGHGGIRYIKGTSDFETAAIHSVLDGAGGKRRDAENLIQMLAHLNNR